MITFPTFLGSTSKNFRWIQENLRLSGSGFFSSPGYGANSNISATPDCATVVSSENNRLYVHKLSNDYKNEISKIFITSSIAGASDYALQVAVNNFGNVIFATHPNVTIFDGSSFVQGAGCVFVYKSGSSGWYEEVRITGSLGAVQFGRFGKSDIATNSIGNMFVCGREDFNQAFIYKSGSSGWYEDAILTGSLASQTSDFFGDSIRVNAAGDRVVIGAYRDENTTGNTNIGLAYVFVSGNNGWTQQQILSGSFAINSLDFFASAVDINDAGDRVIVGAYADEPPGGLADEGLVYVFISGSTGWRQDAVISQGTPVNALQFGQYLSLNSIGDKCVIGGNSEAYIFESGSRGWTRTFQASSSFTAGGGLFQSVFINENANILLVGEGQGGNGNGVINIFKYK